VARPAPRRERALLADFTSNRVAIAFNGLSDSESRRVDRPAKAAARGGSVSRVHADSREGSRATMAG
jgi:hypothetical protein